MVMGERVDRLPRAAWIAIACGALVRVANWLSKFGVPLRLNDSWYYSAQARQLVNGVWFREILHDQPGAEHGPLTSLLMAPVSFGEHWQDWQRLVTVITGCVTVWAIARIALELVGTSAAAVAAAIAAVYPNLWMNDGLVMSESVSMLMVSLSLLFAHRAARDRSVRSMVITGVALGLGVLARSELALLAPLLGIWMLFADRRPRMHWRGVLVSLGVAVGVVAPWVAFNLSRFENPVLLTTNDGTTWLGANCPQTYSGAAIGGWTIECVASDPDYRPDEEPSVRSVRQRGMARQFVAEASIGTLGKVALARVARTLDLHGLDDLVTQDVGEERPRWAVWAGIAMFWMMAPLAVVGAMGLRRRTRALLLAPVAVALVTTVLFYGAHRIRSSAEPALVVLATSGALVLWNRLRPQGAT
ncbi:MAG: hypothetical protein RI900_2909 [Actinomycetota bacterium]|jgi:hypothetical protein